LTFLLRLKPNIDILVKIRAKCGIIKNMKK